MIAAWRREWHAGTGGQTDPTFPFGFVQLSTWGNPNMPFGSKGNEQGVPIVRFGQTANFGYVPNPKMPCVSLVKRLLSEELIMLGTDLVDAFIA